MIETGQGGGDGARFSLFIFRHFEIALLGEWTIELWSVPVQLVLLSPIGSVVLSGAWRTWVASEHGRKRGCENGQGRDPCADGPLWGLD
jgi:membrane protein implicated in regulation of membrane protease activity